MPRKTRAVQVHEQSVAWFFSHKIRVLHYNGMYKHYICARNFSPEAQFESTHSFELLFAPNHLLLNGDFGLRVFTAIQEDMFSWLINIVDFGGIEQVSQCAYGEPVRKTRTKKNGERDFTDRFIAQYECLKWFVKHHNNRQMYFVPIDTPHDKVVGLPDAS